MGLSEWIENKRKAGAEKKMKEGRRAAEEQARKVAAELEKYPDDKKKFELAKQNTQEALRKTRERLKEKVRDFTAQMEMLGRSLESSLSIKDIQTRFEEEVGKIEQTISGLELSARNIDAAKALYLQIETKRRGEAKTILDATPDEIVKLMVEIMKMTE